MIVYDAGDSSRIGGKAWCERNGLDPNDVARIEDHDLYAMVTFIKRNAEGKPYLEEGADEIAKETKRIVLPR